VDDFICWAKEHIDTDIDSSTWDYRVGATNIVFYHYKEAIVALEKAEQHSQTNWGLFFNLAKAHENEKNHRTALKYIQKFKSLSELFRDTDDSYKESYWHSLIAEGNCFRKCHDYDLAVKSFQDLLHQDIDEASGVSWLQLYALSGLFTTWTDTKSFQSIIDLMRSWKDATAQGRSSTYWLRRATYEDALHTAIIVAARHVGAVEEVISLYQEAIDYKPSNTSTVDELGVDVSDRATEQVQYFQAVLRFHGSRSRSDQHRSIEYWEEIVRRSDENPGSYFTAWSATRKLGPTLLDKAVVELVEASSSSSEDYIGRLEKLANLNTTIICNLRQGYYDPRLCLARLYCVKKDHTSASKQAQARLCSVFDKWPETTDDESFRMRFSNLAQTLAVLDKDADAVAAWQAIRPYGLSNASKTTVDEPGTEQPSSELPHANGTSEISDKKPEDMPEASQPIATTTTTKAYLSDYSCDGDCGTEWPDMLADCWVCKHCFCVQLCPGCYKKLLDDDLRPLICNKEHKMLYLPPFDWEAWRAMPADMMTVDKKLVARKEWVDKIRKEYNVQQEEIDFIKMEKARELKAASVIAVRWRNRLQRMRAKKPSAAPKLRRSRTVG
jgi:tetratricopeptide (TPR) repeat protein